MSSADRFDKMLRGLRPGNSPALGVIGTSPAIILILNDVRKADFHAFSKVRLVRSWNRRVPSS